MEVKIRIPPALQHLDRILLYVTYTPDFLNDAYESPINPDSDCYDCVRPAVARAFDQTCDSFVDFYSVCLTNYYLWDKAEQETPGCGIEERSRMFRSHLVAECVGK